MKEQKLLNITSILLMIYGALVLIASLADGPMTASELQLRVSASMASVISALVNTVITAAGALSIYAGYHGRRYQNVPSALRLCLFLGWVLILAILARFILISAATLSFRLFDLVSLLCNLILPGLYIYSAKRITEQTGRQRHRSAPSAA